MRAPHLVEPRSAADLSRSSAMRWAQVATLAARQHGVVLRDQIRHLGVTDRQIDGAVASGRLHRLHRGVFAAGHERVSATGRCAAAVLACGAGAALGYRSAGASWELRASSVARVEVVVPLRSARSHAGVVVHRHAGMQEDEVTVRDGIATTTVARTLLDLAAVLDREQLRSAIRQAELAGLFDLRAVGELLARHPRHRGARLLAEVLRSWEVPANVRSILESAFVELARREGFPTPVMNGTLLGMEIDAMFPNHGVAVELDSTGFHVGVVQRENDYAKRARVEAAGWRFVAFTYRQVVDGDGAFAAGILRDLLARSAGRGGPGPYGHT